VLQQILHLFVVEPDIEFPVRLVLIVVSVGVVMGHAIDPTQLWN
jgi:hypothetical protein